MKILALDLAKSTGWAIGNKNGSITSGTRKFTSSDFSDLASDFMSWIRGILETEKPDIVVYEAPVVKHPHASKILIGLSWLTIIASSDLSIPSFSVGNTAVKKHFVGKVYGKSLKPYPGIIEAQRRGFNPKTTDEADAIAIIYYVRNHPDTFKR